MIFVTLGTQDKSFKRLLNLIQEQIDKGNIKDKVIVQAGYTKFRSDNMEIYDYIDNHKFTKLINSCDLLITHGGVGSILTGLKANKKIIAVPRLEKYKEHTNDHQLQIVNNFSQKGYILSVDGNDLAKALKQSKTFKPKKWKFNNTMFLSKLKNYIDNN